MFCSKTAFIVQTARGYATGAVSQTIKAPIQIPGLAGRYAHALYSAATKKNVRDIVEKDLLVFQSLCTSNPLFDNFIGNTSLRKIDRQGGLAEVLKKGGFAPMTMDFLDMVVANNRISLANEMIESFQKIMSAYRKEVPITAYSAKIMSDADRAALKKQLKRFVAPGETIVLETKVDPSLIGGLKIDLGDRTIDMSIASKIKKISTALRVMI